MIAFLDGLIAEKNLTGVVIDVSGVGYALFMSTKSLAGLPKVGDRCRIRTYMQVSDSGVTLYGFCDDAEKELFERLITVSGVGPKVALSALSTFSPAELASVIAAGDVAGVGTIPGIGKKTAQRIILELQGKLETSNVVEAGASSGLACVKEATLALEGMGFSSEEIASALKGVDVSQADTSTIIRRALKSLGSV